MLPAVLPRFHQGLFSKDKNGSEKAKQRWLDAVKQATTVSRLHLLLEILDSTIIWDLSAENAVCMLEQLDFELFDRQLSFFEPVYQIWNCTVVNSIWLALCQQRCKICRRKGFGTTLIICNDCNLSYHLKCLRPALSEVPEGHWSCLACKVMNLSKTLLIETDGYLCSSQGVWVPCERLVQQRPLPVHKTLS